MRRERPLCAVLRFCVAVSSRRHVAIPTDTPIRCRWTESLEDAAIALLPSLPIRRSRPARRANTRRVSTYSYTSSTRTIFSRTVTSQSGKQTTRKMVTLVHAKDRRLGWDAGDIPGASPGPRDRALSISRTLWSSALQDLTVKFCSSNGSLFETALYTIGLISHSPVMIKLRVWPPFPLIEVLPVPRGRSKLRSFSRTDGRLARATGSSAVLCAPSHSACVYLGDARQVLRADPRMGVVTRRCRLQEMQSK